MLDGTSLVERLRACLAARWIRSGNPLAVGDFHCKGRAPECYAPSPAPGHEDAALSSFIWTDDFATGLERVDEQHQGLVDLLNRFENHLVEGTVTQTELDATLTHLTQYAQKHFRDEEYLMRESGIDARHLDEHHRTHERFFVEVQAMLQGRSGNWIEAARTTHQFLTHWLTYHILGMDQDMARQLHAIAQGVKPGDAYAAESNHSGAATEPLLRALNGLFQQVSERNRELAELNQTLERKVEERTRKLAELNRHLEELSLTDLLTQLPNRRHAMQRLQMFWAQALQDNEALACVMIDADHFKEVNDTYGHDKGDRVLSELARILQHTFRNDDVVCRLGGDEFFAICPKTDLAGGLLIAERVREKVAQMRVDTGGEPWVGSISMGVAARTEDMSDADALVKCADRGVYAAKNAGKNCVRSIQDPTD